MMNTQNISNEELNEWTCVGFICNSDGLFGGSKNINKYVCVCVYNEDLSAWRKVEPQSKLEWKTETVPKFPLWFGDILKQND